MTVSSEYLDYVHDQLSGLGGVTSRRMFGGAGLYCDEFFFALIDNDTLYLRVNDANRADFTTRGMSQFRPYPDSPQLSMSYYETPADVLEDAAQERQSREHLSVLLAERAPWFHRAAWRRERLLGGGWGYPPCNVSGLAPR